MIILEQISHETMVFMRGKYIEDVGCYRLEYALRRLL